MERIRGGFRGEKVWKGKIRISVLLIYLLSVRNVISCFSSVDVCKEYLSTLKESNIIDHLVLLVQIKSQTKQENRKR